MSKDKLIVGLVLDDTIDTSDGVQQFVLTFGNWLEKEGHEVFYLTGESYRTDLKNLYSLSHNVHVRFNGNRFTIPLPASKQSINQVLRANFDILHIQMPYSPMMAGKVIKLADKSTAIIGSFHIAPYGSLASLATKGLGIISKKTVAKFDQVMAVSLPAAQMVKETYKIEPKIVGNMFDYKKFNLVKPYKREADIELLFLGRLVKRKGCHTLLAALALIQRSTSGMPKCRLTIAGDGSLRSELEEYVRKNSLEQWVRFVGYVKEEDKPRYYASADISIFPSFSGESFGYVLLEAMASGKTAVIAADNPGYKSLLNGDQRMLFPAGDEISLASKIKEYIYNQSIRLEVAQRGMSIAKSYDQEEVGPVILQEYQRALHRRQC